MATLRERKNPARLFLRRLMLAGLFVLVLVAGSGVWDIYQKEQTSAILKQEAIAQLEGLSTEQSQLVASVNELKTERGKEAALRQQYNMADPGEGEIMIVEPATSAAPQAPTSTSFARWIKSAFPWW